MQRQPNTVELILIPAPGDGRIELREIHYQLAGTQVEIFHVGGYVLPKSSGAELSDVVLRFAPTLGPIVGAAVGAWLQAKYGRKVRLKIGDLEAEAQSSEEVKKLLDQAEQFQQRNRPNIIQKP